MFLALLAGGLLLMPEGVEARNFKIKNNVRANGKRPKAKADDARFKIEGFRISRLRGRRFELSIGGYHRTARKRSEVTVYFVDGAQKHRLWSDKVTFAKRQGGFSNTVTVDLAGRQGMHRAHLEVVAKVCRDLPQCRKKINLNGGDLHVEGRPQFSQAGSASHLGIKVKNEGPGRSPTCQAVLKDGNTVLARKSVSRLNVGREASVRFEYPRGKRGTDAKVVLECRDLERSNNSSTIRLR
jgi:hypothetical protein